MPRNQVRRRLAARIFLEADLAKHASPRLGQRPGALELSGKPAVVVLDAYEGEEPLPTLDAKRFEGSLGVVGVATVDTLVVEHNVNKIGWHPQQLVDFLLRHSLAHALIGIG
jgi:hypothetical protein